MYWRLYENVYSLDFEYHKGLQSLLSFMPNCNLKNTNGNLKN